MLKLSLRPALPLVLLLSLACSPDRPTAPAGINADQGVSFCCGGGPPPVWTATKLTLPTGTWTGAGAKGVNDTGVVVGYVQVANYKYRPVRWTNGVPNFLVVTTQNHWALPQAINNNGDIVGQVQWISGNLSTPVQPVRWVMPGGLMQTLPNLGYDGWAMDVNNSGVAVGISRATSAGQQHAVKWSSSGTITDLHPLGATKSLAQGINDFGEIVGIAKFGTAVHGWKWKTDNSQLDLGLVWNESVAEIDGNSEAVATVQYQGISQAVMFTPNGTIIGLGAGSGSIATSIGESRRIVGVNGAIPWTTRFDTPVNMPLPSGAGYAFPEDLNRCGMVVGSAAGGTLTSQVAVKWTKSGCDP